jgi:hypothetical protein
LSYRTVSLPLSDLRSNTVDIKSLFYYYYYLYYHHRNISNRDANTDLNKMSCDEA